MFVAELAASWVSSSLALQADALDFFGDAANYAITLFVLGMSLRARSYVAIAKGVTMGAFGIWVLGGARCDSDGNNWSSGVIGQRCRCPHAVAVSRWRCECPVYLVVQP